VENGRVFVYCAGENGSLTSKMVKNREKKIAEKHYFRNESYALCQEAFPNDTVPNKTTIYLHYHEV
jgi:hypothetical protein